MEILSNIRNSVDYIMTKIDFCHEAKLELLSVFDKLALESPQDLRKLLTDYDAGVLNDFNEILNGITKLGKKHGIHEFTAKMLILLCHTTFLRKKYSERGICEKIFYDTMCDFRYKLEECRLIKGITGTFVADWFFGFFNLTRFHLGRLQFEVLPTPKNFILNGKTLEKDTKYINIHIPRTNTKLSHSLVEESYKLAADFFGSKFQDQPIYFGCHSWLLYPWNIKVLKPESNMAAFYNDFTIVESGDNEDYREIWRLFDCEYNGNPDDLPCDTSLRISYANRIKNGEAWGWGMGIFEYKK